MAGARLTPGWRASSWIVAAAIALLATSRWLGATRVEYLVIAATATAIAGALIPRLARVQRRWAVACVVALALSMALAAATQHRLARFSEDWNAERARIGDRAVGDLLDAVDDAHSQLQTLARRALAAPSDRARAFSHLASVRPTAADAALLERRGDPYAWSGRAHVLVDSGAVPFGVVGTAFYLAMFATAESGSDRASATRLLYAAPPADRIARTVGGDIAARTRIAGFEFAPASDSASLQDSRVARVDERPLFAVRADVLTQGELRVRTLERARLWIALFLAAALAAFIVAAWRGWRSHLPRLALVAVGLLCVAFTPLSAFSNYSRLFDPALYFTPLGRALTANAAALSLTSALVLLTLLAVVRRRAYLPDRRLAIVVVLVVAGLGPFLLRDLARGIQIPSYGVSASLWLIWEVPLFLAAAAVMLAGAAAGSAALGVSRGLPPVVAPGLAVLAALMAPVVWEAPGQWPWWYTFIWVATIASLAVSRRTGAVIAAAATVAALGATTLVWGATTRARVRLAEQDVAMLGAGDPYARGLAERLGDRVAETRPGNRQALLRAYATSDLAAAGYPAWLALWRTADAPVATLSTSQLNVPLDSLGQVVQRAGAGRARVAADLPGSPALEHAIAIPTDSGVVTIVVAPQSRLIPPDPFARLLGIEPSPEVEPPYTLQIAAIGPSTVAATPAQWRREGNELHGDWIAATGTGLARVHVEVELRPLFALTQRGTLIALLNLAIVGLLWLTSVLADGIASRWIAVGWRRWARSYRIRLTLALFAFFMLPAIAFAIWSYQQLSTDAARARQLLVRETLRAVSPDGAPDSWLTRESRRLQSPLLLYQRGELTSASDSLIEQVAPTGKLLGPEIALALLVHGEVSAHHAERVAGAATLFGYRTMQLATGEGVVAAPARADELALGRRARDLGVLVLFATAIGALAALWLSGIAARQLARPIGSLRHAALALASGEREPALEGRPTVEFLPVFAAFRRMMSDLNASRSALEEATRRTATVLRNVGSGVIALDDHGVVTLANPRADELLGARLPPGTRLAEAGPRELASIVQRFLAGDSDEETFEMQHADQQWRGRLTRLSRGGLVVTLEDVSEIARAQRILAWGEMARQVAHEIKNPLTPIRLGVQHLRRARANTRVDFDRVLEQNVERILREIDRLDEIARAFSRYGQPPEQRAGAEPTDVAAVVRDLVELETMGDDQTRWAVRGTERPVFALARREELREVLLNVFENARLARAEEVQIAVSGENGRVRVTVRDDGHGIPADVLPRIFEPHFSTRTSGSGLGLAISRRLIESWGGTIAIESRDGAGTIVTIELLNAT